MAKVTGIGGVFFKARDPKTLGAWYETHLGVKIESRRGSPAGDAEPLPVEPVRHFDQEGVVGV